MGKLVVGRYGEPPSAESIPMSLKDCHLKLGLKPSDFVSNSEPEFFKKSDGAFGRYLVFKAETDDLTGPMWKAGYYLLPVDPTQTLNALKGFDPVPMSSRRRVVEIEKPTDLPADVLARATAWADQMQGSLLNCACSSLELRVKAPWGLRRRWEAHLACPKRCQPALKGHV